MRRTSASAVGAALGAVAVLLTGCVTEAVGEGSRAEPATTIEVMYPVGGDTGETFQEEVRIWARQNAVAVEFSPTGSINELIVARVQGNDPPDVALFSHPAVLRQMVERDAILELSDVVDPADRDAMLPDLLAVGQVAEGLYAVPVGVRVESAVFYPETAAARAGLAGRPATLAALRSLTDRIAGTGATPWCFGVESEETAGWPAADWVESLMLINYGSTVFQQWVDHEIPFDDPRVAAVLEQLKTLLLDEGRTNGGRDAVLSTEVQAAADPMFTDPPGCYLYRQGGFMAREGGFPEEVIERIDDTVGVFALPGLTPASKPVLGGGHLAGVLNPDSTAARELVRFLASPEFGTNGYAEGGTWISPRSDFDTALYPTRTWRALAGIAHGSTEFVLDGSDRMPREVGSGSFPAEMAAWISGEQDVQTTLDNIEATWPV
jgi:alpha-glucoside transport system substrate-binding protein